MAGVGGPSAGVNSLTIGNRVLTSIGGGLATDDKVLAYSVSGLVVGTVKVWQLLTAV